MLKRIFTKKTSKADSKKTSTKKGAKKKKIIKSTEKAVKKKMAPTKKTKYVQDSEGNSNGKNIPQEFDDVPGTDSIVDAVSNANNLIDDAANGNKPSEDPVDLASGKNNS